MSVDWPVPRNGIDQIAEAMAHSDREGRSGKILLEIFMFTWKHSGCEEQPGATAPLPRRLGRSPKWP